MAFPPAWSQGRVAAASDGPRSGAHAPRSLWEPLSAQKPHLIGRLGGGGALRDGGLDVRLPDGVITARQAAEKYKVGINTIYRLQNEGILPWWVRNGTTTPRLMRESDFVAWILGNDPRRG